MDAITWFYSFVRQAARGLAALVVTAVVVSGCGGSSNDTASGTTGEVAIALTDAPGDFVAYSVDVVSITLTKANGTTVEALPVSTRIDFAQYSELTEFITSATIPSGTYTAARLRLNYALAEIIVEDANGNAVAAVARDAGGNPITTLDLNVRFDNQRPLTIVPGVPAHLTLDFNRAASIQVDLTAIPAVITVLPLLVADINPEQHKTHRVRGPLVNVDTANARFTLGIRPPSLRTGDLGRLAVTTDGNTHYEIDQTAYQGPAGP